MVPRNINSLLFFVPLAFLVVERVCLFLFFCSYLCSTPFAKQACNLRKFAHSLGCFPFLLSCFLLLLPCLTTWTFFSLFPFGCVIFSIFISSFRLWVVIFIILSIFFWEYMYGLIGFCGDFYSVPHVSDTYERGPPFLCLVWGVDVPQLSCVLLFACLIFFAEVFFYFHSLQSCWSLSCDHGLHCVVAMS